METKKSLDIYRIGKREITKENFYDNAKASALLFEDRAGCLRTKTLIRKQAQEEELCVGCGNGPETMRHVVPDCKDIQPVLNEGGAQLPEALGLKVNGKLDWTAIEVSKRRLEC